MHFENYKSRVLDQCGFVCVPNKQHGMGFTRIMLDPNGAAVYGIWQLIVGACSQQRKPRQGWLTDNGKPDGHPWTAEDLALKFRRPIEEIQNALKVLSSPAIGWLVIQDFSAQDTAVSRTHPRSIPQETPQYLEEVPAVSEAEPRNIPSGGDERKKERKKEGKEGGDSAPQPSRTLENPADAEIGHAEINLIGLTAAFPWLDVRHEFEKYKKHCRINHRKIDSERFTSWLNRCERPVIVEDAAVKPPKVYSAAEHEAARKERFKEHLADT